jgi:hypothetical protein
MGPCLDPEFGGPESAKVATVFLNTVATFVFSAKNYLKID